MISWLDKCCCSGVGRPGSDGELDLAGNKRCKVFWSGHLTDGHENSRQKWLAPASEAESEIRASMPPFNEKNKGRVPIPERVKCFNVPAFGPSIAAAVMRIFASEELRAIAARLGIRLPENTLSKFVQEKMPKVHDMVRYARESSQFTRCDGAVDKLEKFVKEFEALTPAQIPDMAAWQKFVNRHTQRGWESKLHFDHLLGNFGFDKVSSDHLRQHQFTKPDGEQVTFEQHAFRWLSKAFSAYGPEGALTDVVNLVFAMLDEGYEKLSDVDIAKVIDKFQQRLASGAKGVSSMWVPSHLFMDAEGDDCMCWVLLEHVHLIRSTKLEVLVQLPVDAELDELATRLDGLQNCAVWRDPDARNAKAVKAGFGIL